ncbi:MAG: DUF72 domain-containing protein [Dehalococcoidia bacterium]|nr:DUF72 domain-containing protein [Dehalococcoidia bacterium]
MLVGTASWTDATLIKSGRFYPADARTPEQRLRFYASQFPVVEVDSTFYSLPSFNNSVLWANRTPQHFVFDVKLFRAFTLHQTPLKSLPKDLRGTVDKACNVYYGDLPTGVKDDLWRLFLEGVAPLRSARHARLPTGVAASLAREADIQIWRGLGVSQNAVEWLRHPSRGSSATEPVSTATVGLADRVGGRRRSGAGWWIIADDHPAVV